VVTRSPEATAFFESAQSTDPRCLSACAGWTAHEVTAHVTGIAVEVIRHLDPFLAGDPVPATRSFEEREAPLRELAPAALLSRLDSAEVAVRELIATVLDGDADAVIPWTGREMAVAKFVPHLRNEYTLHRWDIVGDDETSAGHLGAPDLIEHSVSELGEILLRKGRRDDPDPDDDFAARLHTPDQPDLVVTVSGDSARISLAADRTDATPTLSLDRQARHLLIWGRRADHRGALSDLTPEALARLQTLLSGY
jgi:hypothetical protein